MEKLVRKVKWELPGSPKTEMYMYGEASVEANQAMQEPLEKLYRYENSATDRKIINCIRKFDSYVRDITRIPTDENVALFEHWIDCIGEIQDIIYEKNDDLLGIGKDGIDGKEEN